jgi:hypothetical protein
MLFISDRYLPKPPPSVSFGKREWTSQLSASKSAHKWPEPIAFDTNLLTNFPPLLPVLAKAPVINQPREALAHLNSPLPKASEYRAPVRVKRKVAKEARLTRMAAYRAPPEAMPAGC